MKSSFSNEKKALVVIPDWGLVWTVYCLEYAVKLSDSGVNVLVLDLSNLNPAIKLKRFRRKLDKFVRKNPMSCLKKEIVGSRGIELIEVLPGNSPVMRETLSEEREKIFRSAMASKYSGNTGRRDTQLFEIDDRVVRLEKRYFSLTMETLHELISNFPIDEVFTVNGRYVVDGAVVQACKELDVFCGLLESASAKGGRYTVYKKSPHDIKSVQDMHVELWENADTGKMKIAEEGLGLKLSGREAAGYDYQSNFKEEFRGSKPMTHEKIAAFFPSSDREFAIFPEFVYQESFSGSQAEAFLAFSKIARSFGYRVIVRVHPPNAKSPRKLQDKFAEIEDKIWQKLCLEGGAEMIASRSNVSSYDLIRKAHLCGTYASSISIECLLMEKPIVILGEAEISYCVPEICAFNADDLFKLIQDGVPLIPRESLYPYGYWLRAAGTNLVIFKFISDSEVYWDGNLVNEYRSWIKPLALLRHRINS